MKIEDNLKKIIKHDKDIENLGSQLEHIANKGTTVEVLERVTKDEIDRQVADGTIANLTIKSDSVTGDKINGDNITYSPSYSNSENSIIGRYVTMEGTIDVEPSMAYFIVDVEPNTEYKVKGLTGETTYGMEADIDGNKITVYSAWLGTQLNGDYLYVTTSSNARKLCINIGKDNVDKKINYVTRIGYIKKKLNWLDLSDTEIKSKWIGKKAVMIGDSITSGADGASGGSSSVPENSNYPNQIKSKLGLSSIINYGMSGTTIAETSGDDNGMGGIAFVNRYSQMDSDADLIIVAGGTNDYGMSYTVPIGNIDDTEKTTFYGALNYLCNGLIEKYCGKTIVFLTPLHRSNETPNTVDKKLIDYVNAIKEVCELWGIPAIDIYTISGFTPKNSTFKNTYLPDGLHPNEAGYKLLVDRIYKNFELI